MTIVFCVENSHLGAPKWPGIHGGPHQPGDGHPAAMPSPRPRAMLRDEGLRRTSAPASRSRARDRIAMPAHDRRMLLGRHISERLLTWTDEAIREDLVAYPGVDPTDAISMRDELLRLLKTEGDPR